jgi:hypothetical protein
VLQSKESLDWASSADHNYVMAEKMRQMPANRAVVLRNETCPYCGAALTPSTGTKEHVVGRRFVPRGSLHQHWNLIVRACRPCNNRKAALEDDISAISMHPDVTGAHVRDDVRLHAEAGRKARTKSQRSGKPVGQSQEQFSVKMPFGAAEITLNFISAPQADEPRILDLARLHVMAFFYWITVQPGEVNGRFWPGSFMPLPPVRRADWGNEQQRFFMNLTADWDFRVHAVTADGYFKIAIKKHPDRDVWSFALEWSESYRIVGFFGEVERLHEIRDSIPALPMQTIPGQGADFMRFRQEAPLADEDDVLFALSDEEPGEDV